MFTGLIETIGRVQAIRHRANYLVLTIASDIAVAELQEGDSICCDGACLTVTSHTAGSLSVEASQETTARTTVGSWQRGRGVNLERALRADSRLGGHFVTGHVDCIGTVDRITPVGESLALILKYDYQSDPLVVDKGSIALNGVSLTVNESAVGWASVNLIPITVQKTALGLLRARDKVNIEFDLIGKYVIKQLQQTSQTGLTMKKLLESGW